MITENNSSKALAVAPSESVIRKTTFTLVKEAIKTSEPKGCSVRNVMKFVYVH